jgi:hypothetical protein
MIGSGRSIRGAPRGGSTPSPQNNAPRGTPSAAAQNAFRGIIRIVTPVVNLINRVVQGVTGGRGGIAQLARGLTGLVNQAYQRATGQAWGAQSGTGGAGAGDGASEDDTPALPPPPPTPDIGESDDRLRALNEDDEETRPFNWQEFFGDDFTVEDIGDSMRESAEWFLRFVRGEVDNEVPLLTQIRTLFEEARGRLDAALEPPPVDENWTSLTSETLDARFGEGWIEYIAGDENEAQALITLIDYDAQDMFGIDLASDLQGLTAQEAVDMYIERLGSLPEDPFAVRERAFWETVRNTFGVSQDVTRDLSEFATYELDLPQTISPADADAAVNDLIQDYVESGLIDPEAAQGMTREEIAYAYYQATMAELQARQAATDERVIELTGILSLMPRGTGIGGSLWLEGAVQDSRAPYQVELDSITQELANLRDRANQASNLVRAFNSMYTPPQTPYGQLLLIVMSFVPGLETAAAVTDLVRSVSEGDIVGTVLSVVDLLPGPNIGAFDNAFAIVGRNTDELLGIRYAPDERGFWNIGQGRRRSTIEGPSGSEIDVVINTAHGFDRPHTIPGTSGQTSAFSRTQLTQNQVENAILDDVSQQLAQGLVLPVPSSTNSASSFYNGTIVVEGLEIGYHAVQTQDGRIRISTYYLTQAN